mgnify:CR=1 FL=1
MIRKYSGDFESPSARRNAASELYAAVTIYNAAVLHGIVKIASKMGISTIQSYQGSQIFEAIGIGEDVITSTFDSDCQQNRRYHYL